MVAVGANSINLACAVLLAVVTYAGEYKTTIVVLIVLWLFGEIRMSYRDLPKEGA
jgi:hypothetical protein